MLSTSHLARLRLQQLDPLSPSFLHQAAAPPTHTHTRTSRNLRSSGNSQSKQGSSSVPSSSGMIGYGNDTSILASNPDGDGISATSSGAQSLHVSVGVSVGGSVTPAQTPLELHTSLYVLASPSSHLVHMELGFRWKHEWLDAYGSSDVRFALG